MSGQSRAAYKSLTYKRVRLLVSTLSLEIWLLTCMH